MSRVHLFASLFLAASGVSYAQQNCDAALVQRNKSSILDSKFVQWHAVSFAIDRSIEMDEGSFSSLTPKGKFDAEYAKKTASEVARINRSDYKYAHSRSVLISHLPDGALDAWIGCIRSNTNDAQFFAVPRKASSSPDSIAVKLVWLPGSFHPQEELQITSQALGLPKYIRIGEVTVDIPRQPYSDFSMSVNARSSVRDFTTDIYVPGPRTFRSIVYLKDEDEVAGTCSNADGVPCVVPGKEMVFTSPPEGGLSKVSFRVPQGAYRFLAELSPGGCPGANAWVYVNDTRGRIPNGTLPWPATQAVNLPLAEGTDIVTFGADALGTRLCDSVMWSALRVLVKEEYR